MVKTERFSRPALTALFVLAVFLIAVFALSTNVNADGVADVDVTSAVSSLSSYFTGFGLHNQEYPDANFINFLLCLHDYDKLPAGSTVTVTAYLPVTNTVFWRSTFTQPYMALKDAVNVVGHGTVLRLPADCVLKIEVNGATIKGWDLIYGSTVEEAVIWHPSSGFTGVAADYVPGNATYLFMSNIGGHVVHLDIDGADGSSSGGGDADDPDDPSGGGDADDPDDPSGGGDDPSTPDTPDKPDTPDTPSTPDTPDKPGTPDTPSTPDTPDKPGTPDTPSTPDTPDKPDTPDTPDTPDKPGTPDDPNTPDTPDKPDTPDNPDTPDKPTEPKTPSETGDTRSVALMSAIALISLAVLVGTSRRKKPN